MIGAVVGPLAILLSFLWTPAQEIAWGIAGLGGFLSLIFIPTALLTGLFCLPDRDTRRPALLGMGAAGVALLLWVACIGAVIYLLLRSPGCC